MYNFFTGIETFYQIRLSWNLTSWSYIRLCLLPIIDGFSHLVAHMYWIRWTKNYFLHKLYIIAITAVEIIRSTCVFLFDVFCVCMSKMEERRPHRVKKVPQPLEPAAIEWVHRKIELTFDLRNFIPFKCAVKRRRRVGIRREMCRKKWDADDDGEMKTHRTVLTINNKRDIIRG